MTYFLETWREAALTSVGFFWMALWAFCLGYIISSLIQVLVTRQRMREVMGKAGPKSMAMGAFFGFISSSCSFAALATTRALFQKGAGLAPSMAFLLASTNLVIELGIVIALFLGWQFVVGEYVGGVLLILVAWLFIRITRPDKLIRSARRNTEEPDEKSNEMNWKAQLTSLEGWQSIGETYVMEWQMIWRDVLIGFTLAGVIAAFVPISFFETLFIGSASASNSNPGFFAVVQQILVGPLAAFMTFIGSMGNIPLAALLFDRGVSFAGVMAFIFSDLVVFPVLRINAAYYGWKMALYILLMLFSGLVITALILHYGLVALDLLPARNAASSIMERDFFQWDYSTWFNIAFLAVSVVLLLLWRKAESGSHDHDHSDRSLTEVVLARVSNLAVIWLMGGLFLVPVFRALTG